MMVEMKVSGLTIDPLTNMPILVLKDKDGKNAVPIAKSQTAAGSRSSD